MSAIPDIQLDLKPSRKRTERVSGLVDSGIPWIGQAPASWPIKRLRWTIDSARNGIWGNEPDGENDIPCVRVADFDRVSFRVTGEVPTLRGVTVSERRGRVLENGDLLLEKSGGGESQPVGAVALYDSDVPSVCSNFLARLVVAPGCDGRFLSYLHAHLYSARVNTRSIKQTTGIQNLDAYSYFSEQVPVPPLEEQRAIAAFLDRETAKMDELIAKKRSLQALLHEKRSCITSRTVLGLTESTPRQSTSSVFFPTIPSGWKLIRLKFVCREVADGPHFSPAYVSDGIPFLSARNVKVDRWALEDAKFISEEVYAECCKRIVPTRGDVLYTKGGTTGIARAVDFDTPFHVWVHIIVLKLSRRLIDPHYLAYALNTRGCYEQSQLYTRGATNNDLGLTRVVNIVLPLPPIDVQARIVRFLDAQTEMIDQSLQLLGAALDRLNEYRSALISAAVTGQIDVRHYREEVPCP